MGRLLVFNPEHDYALASEGRFFPRKSMVGLSRSLFPICRIWGEEDDLYLDPLYGTFNQVVTGTPVSTYSWEKTITGVDPWGWDSYLCENLSNLGIKSELIPNLEYIENVRRLSHRRISISCNKFMESAFIPCEFHNPEEAFNFYKSCGGRCCFKTPWSSSGRGFLKADEIPEDKVLEWIKGAISKQGSVMGESLAKKSIDFASLWETENRRITFKGFSISKTDGRGKYHGNWFGPQKMMEQKIRDEAPDFNMDYICRQERFIKEYIAPFYNGKLGIDMMSEIDGIIRPCIEINLRNTMGHVALNYYEKITSGRLPEGLPENLLKLFVPL